MCAWSVRLKPFTGSGQGQDIDQQERDYIFTCKLLCCKCSFCHRVATKERRKSQLLLQSHRNKICERGFLCRSLEFCKYCHKCPNCCHKSTCRGKATSVLGEVGGSGFESKSSRNTQRGLHRPLPVQTQFNQVTNCHKQLCQPTKTVPPFGGTVSAGEEKCSGTGNKPKLTGVLQLAIFGTQTQQPVETYPGPEHFEHLPKHRVIQDGDPRDNKDLPADRGVGHLHRLLGRIPPYTNSQSVQEVHAFSHPGSVLPVQRKASPPRSTSYETHTVALEELEGTRITRKGDTRLQVAPPPLKVVAGGKQCASRSTITPTKTCPADFTDTSKEGWGAHLNERTARGTWSIPESKLINHLELKVIFLVLKQFQDLCSNNIVLVATDNTTVVAYINKEGGNEVGLPVCPTVENPVLVHQETGNSQGTSHPRPAERDSRQAIQTWPDHLNRVVPSPRSVSSYMLPVAPAPSGLVCHQIQQQTSTVCVTGSRPPSLGSGCTQPVLGKIWTHMPSHQHALVLGSGGNVQSDPSVSAQPAQSGISTIQPDPAQEPVKPELTFLAPRATAIKEQGLSEAVAARIEAPQRGSTRSVYEAKWTIFTKWCLSNQVDFRAPPLKAIADFLLHLFQGRKLQPGTIDGYRSAIADKLGNSTINVSKDENLTRLLDSFHRDRPEDRRGIPSWNLSLVLHQLIKAPFEPLKEASLKHLTFKTVFLLVMGSGKRRSAWLHNIRHQSDWSKVSLYPSPSFLSKNLLAKEGPDSVAPVVIPALAPILDKSLKGDRSLCPVRALRYYLDRTSDLRQNKELVFVSFKKGFDKDISPATISSWIKQTVILLL